MNRIKNIFGYIVGCVVAICLFPIVAREVRLKHPYAFKDYDRLMGKILIASILFSLAITLFALYLRGLI